MSEKLVQYLDGELAGAEKQSIEQYLASDEKLQNEFDSLKETREAIKMYGLQQKVAGIHQQMMQEMQTTVKKMSTARRMIRYSIAVAASVVLIVAGILGYNFYTLSSGKVFASNYHSYELNTARDIDTGLISPVEKAYREKEYSKAAEIYSRGGYITRKETFLAGISFLESGNYTKAIVELKKVVAYNEASANSLFKDEAEYYLALTYIRNKDYDFALDILRSIKENPEHLYHKKITGKLIRQVKMLKWR
jgi:predicted negative regulator of RcsB-dependent stress response